MAKKSFNLSQAIRDALAKNKTCTAAECIDMIRKAHPSVSINQNTAGVTWSKLRREMGLIKGPRRSKKVLKPTRHHGNGVGNGIVSALDAASNLVQAAGGIEQARQILDTLAKFGSRS